jgi:hypothetical protein
MRTAIIYTEVKIMNKTVSCTLLSAAQQFEKTFTHLTRSETGMISLKQHILRFVCPVFKDSLPAPYICIFNKLPYSTQPVRIT